MNSDNRRYINRLAQELSKIKLLIIITLLESGSQFPRGWVESSKLRYLTNSRNFEVYINELRDELGCDIETKDINGERCFRISSYDLKKAKPADNSSLEPSQHEALILYANNACQICGAKLIPGKRELRPDQKIPLARGGGSEFINWQVICSDCNVAKKRCCHDCLADCAKCSWSFPERAENTLVIKLPEDVKNKLGDMGISSRQDIENFLITEIQKALKENP